MWWLTLFPMAYQYLMDPKLGPDLKHWPRFWDFEILRFFLSSGQNSAILLNIRISKRDRFIFTAMESCITRYTDKSSLVQKHISQLSLHIEWICWYQYIILLHLSQKCWFLLCLLILFVMFWEMGNDKKIPILIRIMVMEKYPKVWVFRLILGHFC